MNEKQPCSQCGGSGYFCTNCQNTGVTRGGTNCSCNDSKCSQCNGTGIDTSIETSIEQKIGTELKFMKNYGNYGFPDLR